MVHPHVKTGARLVEHIQRAARLLSLVREVAIGVQAINVPGMDHLQDHAPREKVPADWCYVHDFPDPERPRALELPAGMGVRLQREMDLAVAELRVAMRAAFESEEYRTRKKRMIDEFKERQQKALTEIQESARQRDVAVVETDSGMVLAPLGEGVPLDPEKFQALPAEQQDRLRAEMARVGAELQELLRQEFPRSLL